MKKILLLIFVFASIAATAQLSKSSLYGINARDIKANGSYSSFKMGKLIDSLILSLQLQGGGGGGVSSFNTRTGAITLTSSDVTTALTYTPLNPSNSLSDVGSASTARQNLGGTTVGVNIFTATNPSTISFIKINADNSVTLRNPTGMLNDIGAQAALTLTTTGTSGAATLSSGILNIPQYTGGGGSGISALTGDVTASGTGSVAATVVGANGTLYSGLATGLIRNTTSTGVPTIATDGTHYLSPSSLSANNGITFSGNVMSLSGVYVVSTISALQTYISGLTTGADVIIKFPVGSYSVTSAITIANKGKVIIEADDATLVNAVGASSSVIDISSVTSVYIHGLNIDMNATTQANNNGIKINGVSATVRIDECDIFHFPTTFATTVIGILLDSSPTLSATAPGTTITNCNFYNTVTGGTYNYTSNNNGGTAIKLNSVAEYSKIANNSFVGLVVPIWLVNGANAAISNCDFQENLPYFGSTKYGCIYMQDNVNNIGKLNISNCKFNHNWGHCIFPNYSTLAFNPFTVTGCDFITNAIAPIRIGSSGSSSVQGAIITGNNFRTSNASQTATNNPFTTADCAYIFLFNANNLISGNIFSAGTSSQPAIVSLNSASGQTIRNNYYDPSLTFTSLVGTNLVMMNEQKVTFLPTTTNAGINVGAVASAPSSPVNGDIYYDNVLNNTYSYINGTWTAWGTGGGAGTVTSASVVSANGFAGTVATATTTPAITLTTTITGVIKGNGTAISSAGSSDIITALGYTPQTALTLTTTGTSGAATLVAGTLNIPQYSGGGSSALTSAHLFVGNVSNVATDVAASGDVTLANTGAFTVTKINGNTIPANASGVLTNNGTGTLTWAAAGGTGTVTSVTSATGEITVANTTTTPVLTMVSAPKLTTSRNIQGVAFDGSANITTLTSGSGTTVSGTAVNLGGTLTGLAAIVSNAKNQLTIGGAWTSTLVGDNMMAFGGTITSASSVGATGYIFNPAMTAAGTSSVQVGLDVAPTFSGGTTPVNISFRVQNGVSIFGNFSAPINTETVLVRNDQNAATSQYIINNTNGTTAFAQIGVSSTSALTGAIYLRSFSANYTTTANYNIANTTALVSAATVETNIVVAGNTPLSFWTNATRRASFVGGGAFLLGYTTAIGTEQLGIRTDQNNSTNILVANATSGTAARAEVFLTGSATMATSVTLTAFSAGFTTSGSQAASTGVLRTSLTGGVNISAAASGSQLSLWTSDVKRVAIDGSGNITTTQGAQTSAWAPAWTLNIGTHTGLTTATPFSELLIPSVTMTWVDGTVTDQSLINIAAPTYNGTTTLATFTTGSTMKVTAPIAGAKGAITNNYAIWSNGGLKVSGDITLSGTNTTGAGTALLGANSPAVTNSAPYTWVKFISSDGSTVYVPAWK